MTQRSSAVHVGEDVGCEQKIFSRKNLGFTTDQFVPKGAVLGEEITRHSQR